MAKSKKRKRLKRNNQKVICSCRQRTHCGLSSLIALAIEKVNQSTSVATRAVESARRASDEISMYP